MRLAKNLFVSIAEYAGMHVRHEWLLKFIKNNGNFLIPYFDPNNLRKKYDIKFSEHLITREINNVKLQLNVNDHLGYRYFMQDGFDDCSLWVGEKLTFNKSDIFLDIGANIGTVCTPFAAKYKNEVIAIEALKSHGVILLKNAELNAILMQCYIGCAVDKETYEANRFIKLYVKNGNSGASSLFKTWNPSKSDSEIEFAKTFIIDDLPQIKEDAKKIKLIKIDVEGSEALVLRGMKNLLQEPIPIIFEYRIDIMKRDLKDNGSEMIKLLQEDRKIFGITRDKNNYRLVPFDQNKSYENAISLPLLDLDIFTNKLSS